MTLRRLVIEVEAGDGTCADCMYLEWLRQGRFNCLLFPSVDLAVTRLEAGAGLPIRCLACMNAEERARP